MLARILRDTVEELKNLDLDTIMEALDEPQVRKKRLEPGITNLKKDGEGTGAGQHGMAEFRKKGFVTEEEVLRKYGKALLGDSADIVQNEGAIYFDIKGAADFKSMEFKLLYDVEPQRETYESRLGYPVESRMVFYVARIISSQKDTEFFGDDYGSLKKGVTIWIVPLSGNKEDGSIEVLDLVPRTIYGEPTGLLKGGLMRGVLIGFRKGKNLKKSGNRLIRFLEDLLGDEPFEVKKEKIEKEHGVVMEVKMEKGVRTMCNYASLIREEAEAKGREEGREEGILMGEIIGSIRGRDPAWA